MGIVYADVNGLKEINDTRGHQAGDEALQRAPHLLAKCYGSENAYRMGGDEFLVICPDSDLAAARVVAERLRAAVQAQPVETGGPRLFLTASVGVCMRTPDMESVEALMKGADDALYLAKQRGRNRVVLIQDEPGGG